MKRPYRAEYEARLSALMTQPRKMRIFHPLRSDFVFRSTTNAEPETIP